MLMQQIFQRKAAKDAEIRKVLCASLRTPCLCVEFFIRQMVPNALFLGATLFAQAKERDDIATALGGAFVLYNGVWVTRYSRADEIEADTVGIMYLAKAGYDPRAALRIWERAAQQSSGNDPAASIFSTHPADSVRLQNLRSQLPVAMKAYNASPYRGDR
jgi:predicted Zn-dependent protease